MAGNQLTIPAFTEQFPDNICKVCGQEHRCVIDDAPFKPRMHNPKRPIVTCGKKECQREHLRRRLEAARAARPPKRTALCDICHETFTPRNSRQKTCTKPECQDAAQARWREEHREEHRVYRDDAICKYCGNVFTPYGKRSDHCLRPECVTKFQTESAARTRAKKRAAQPPKQTVCAECGNLFPKRGKNIFCCEEHKEAFYKKQRKERYWAEKDEQNAKSKAYYQQQRALVAEALAARVAQQAVDQQAAAHNGRRRDEEKKQYFIVGKQVEEDIAVRTRHAAAGGAVSESMKRKILIEARRAVSKKAGSQLSYASVVKYHKTFLKKARQ